MSTESASPDAVSQVDSERMRQYKTLAAAFSYPDDNFFEYFPDSAGDKRDIMAEYDRLFRAGAVWLYGAEHLVKNDFQRANLMADIMGFYTAFGLEPDKERPDSITCELEFMYSLIFKRNRASKALPAQEVDEKVNVCRDAEEKFFAEHLEPAARAIADKIISVSSNSFYNDASQELLVMLDCEKKYFNLVTAKSGR